MKSLKTHILLGILICASLPSTIRGMEEEEKTVLTHEESENPPSKEKSIRSLFNAKNIVCSVLLTTFISALSFGAGYEDNSNVSCYDHSYDPFESPLPVPSPPSYAPPPSLPPRHCRLSLNTQYNCSDQPPHIYSLHYAKAIYHRGCTQSCKQTPNKKHNSFSSPAKIVCVEESNKTEETFQQLAESGSPYYKKFNAWTNTIPLNNFISYAFDSDIFNFTESHVSLEQFDNDPLVQETFWLWYNDDNDFYKDYYPEKYCNDMEFTD